MAGHQGSSTRRNTDEYMAALPESERADTLTSATGTIVAYDAKTQTATIQPKMSMIIGGETIRAPELMQVPVAFARAGGLILHKPPKKGDEVNLSFGQRSTEGSIEDGADESLNRGGRMHSMSDATATPAAHSKAKRLDKLPADRMHFGTEDGKSGLQMKDDGKWDHVKGDDSLWKVIKDLAEAFRDHTNNSAENNKKPEAQAIVDRIAKMKAT